MKEGNKRVSTIKNDKLQKTEERIAKSHRKDQEGIPWERI